MAIETLNLVPNFQLAQLAIENFWLPTCGHHSWWPNVFWFAWKKLGATWKNLVVQSRVAMDPTTKTKFGHCPNFVEHYLKNSVA
jgi:glucose-6-phosphate dehydrogenase assembly protein OpcA